MNASKIARRVHGRNPAGVRVTPLRTKSATLRRALAEALEVPLNSLPRDLVSLLAIADYESLRDECVEADTESDDRELADASMLSGFDYQDRRFADENGVCPRCSSSNLIRRRDEILDFEEVVGCQHCNHVIRI